MTRMKHWDKQKIGLDLTILNVCFSSWYSCADHDILWPSYFGKDNLDLTREVYMEDIMDAHFDPNHWTWWVRSCLLRKVWGSIKDELQDSISSFMRCECIFQEMNNTKITLIPQVLGPETLDAYCAISLCNINFWIISKVLANKPNPNLNEKSSLLLKLPSSKGGRSRSISYSPRDYKRGSDFKEGGGAAVKLDMNKSFDRVEKKFFMEPWKH